MRTSARARSCCARAGEPVDGGAARCDSAHGRQGEDVMALSHGLLSRMGGVEGLARASVAELMQEKGLKAAKAASLAASIELGKRIAVVSAGEKKEWKSRLLSIALETKYSDRETIYALFLDARDGLIDEAELSYGGMTGGLSRPSGILPPRGSRGSLRSSAHTQPSGRLALREPRRRTAHGACQKGARRARHKAEAPLHSGRRGALPGRRSGGRRAAAQVLTKRRKAGSFFV